MKKQGVATMFYKRIPKWAGQGSYKPAADTGFRQIKIDGITIESIIMLDPKGLDKTPFPQAKR